MSKGSKTTRQSQQKTARGQVIVDREINFLNSQKPKQLISGNKSIFRNSQNQSLIASFIKSQKKPQQKNSAFHQREIKYLIRIAELEKENQKSNDLIIKFRKENEELQKVPSLQQQINEIISQLKIQKVENNMLKKYVSNVSNFSHTSSGIKNTSTKANTLTSLNTHTNSSAGKIKFDYIPSYIRAMNLIQ